MKKWAIILVFGLSSLPGSGQNLLISRKSNPLAFKSDAVAGKISAQSNILRFNVGVSSIVKVQSGSLAYGKTNTTSVIPEVVAKEEPKIIETIPVVIVPNQNAVVTNTVPERKIEIVEEKPAKTFNPGKALGDEYAYKLPRYYALIIGVANYKFSGANLQSLENPTKDAGELYRVLTQRYSFDTSDVIFLRDPTRRRIIDELELLSGRVGAKDNLLIFYAGHGYYDKQKELGYWIPSDATMSKSDWILNSTVKDYMSSIQSKHTLLITDACFGGSIFKSRAVDAYGIMQVYDLYKDPSRKAITSGNLTEVPDKSLFMEQLLRKLNENEDDFLPSQKLYTRIYEPVTNNSTAIPKFGIIQGAGDEGGDFIFIRRQNPNK